MNRSDRNHGHLTPQLPQSPRYLLPTMIQILVIDDDPILQMVLKQTLQAQGYQVTTAFTGEDGIAQARQQQPALIICDWQMPGMSGLEVCQQIKADPSLASTFFILLTSRSDVSDRVHGLDTGADDFLSKPLEVSELKARVRAGLRLYQSSQELQTLTQALQAQKQALEAELHEAADYVQSLFPKPLAGKITTAHRFLPSKQLGGDCFDYYWLDANHLMLYLLDVSGHGLGAALPSIAVQSLLRSQSLPGADFYQPSSVLAALNHIFQMTAQNPRYFTIWYGIYDQSTRQLTYASAGHPPAVLLGRDRHPPESLRLQTRGKPIGMLPDMHYASECRTIPVGSTLYIFSDGIYEIRQATGELWTLEDFIDWLVRRQIETPHSHPDTILQQIQTIANTTFGDDCSLLQVQFN